jgi:hypothetical protein
VSSTGIVVFCREPALALPLLVLVISWLRRIAREDAALSAALGVAHATYVRDVPALDFVRGIVRLLHRRRAAKRAAGIRRVDSAAGNTLGSRAGEGS